MPAPLPRAAVAHGWSVIPVQSDKRPLFPWKRYQSSRLSVEELGRSAKRREVSGWAIVTGAISGIVILDFDGDQGNAQLAKLGLQPHVRTGSGGHHVYFRYPGFHVPTLNSKSKHELGAKYPGVDIRADGGYAVFLGSNKTGSYRWLRKASELEDVQRLPMPLRRLLGLVRPEGGGSPDAPRKLAGSIGLADLVNRALARPGGRNDNGMWLACQLRDAQLSLADAESWMRQYQSRVPQINAKGQREPYAWPEARATLRSAFSSPAREPLQTKSSRPSAKARARDSYRSERPQSGQGGGPAQVNSVAVAEPPAKRAGEYELRQDGIVWWKNGESEVRLCNFQAAVVADITRDDGTAEVQKAFRLWTKTVKGGERVVQLGVTEFREMNWAIEKLDFSALVQPNQGDRLRAALQALSIDRDLPMEYVYSHTGWSQRAKGFLSAGGCIDANGLRPVEIDVDKRYCLPAPPERGRELERAVNEAMEWIEVTDGTATLPLFAAIWRAPLGQPDCALWLAGKSGNGKSNLAAIAQQFFGADFGGSAGRGAFPTNWEGTANAREYICHANKDVITVVDDFMPRGSISDVERLHKDADRLLRSVGNAAGRDRLNGDMRRRAALYPRGMVVVTGEDVVKHKSAQARCWIVELGSDMRGNMSKLTPYQLSAARGAYAAAMSGYLRWLAPQVERLTEEMHAFRLEFREMWAARGTHARTPDNVASLAFGMQKFLDFATDEKIVSQKRRSFLWSWFLESMAASAKEQEAQQATVEPTKVYLELLRSAFQRGTAHVCTESGNAPANSLLWGWDGVNPKGSRVGFLCGEDDLYIDPQSAWTVIQREGQQANTPIHVSQARISRELAQAGFLRSKDGERFTIQRQVLGVRMRFLHFATGALYA